MSIGASKSRYVYVDDAGKNWVVTIADDKVTGVVPATGLTPYSPAAPPAGGIQGKISAKRCRVVHAQGLVGEAPDQRLFKRNFVCNIAAPLYAVNASQNVSYTPQGEAAGTAITMVTTGRKGEHITF